MVKGDFLKLKRDARVGNCWSGLEVVSELKEVLLKGLKNEFLLIA